MPEEPEPRTTFNRVGIKTRGTAPACIQQRDRGVLIFGQKRRFEIASASSST